MTLPVYMPSIRTCECWDIPRSDCCTCGAYEDANAYSAALDKWYRSQLHARWAFGLGVFR